MIARSMAWLSMQLFVSIENYVDVIALKIFSNSLLTIFQISLSVGLKNVLIIAKVKKKIAKVADTH